jgi:GAF domain-containing protein
VCVAARSGERRRGKDVMTKQQRLAQTFVELADTLVRDFDVVDFLSTLAQSCAELLDAAEVGIMLVNPEGGLKVVASSSERARALELFEIQNQEGPCLDCFRSGGPVSVEDLEGDPARWAVFGPEAIRAGYHSAHALALRCQSQVIGALNLFKTEPGVFEQGDLVSAQAMADFASIAILQQRALNEARVLAEQLQSALNSRVIIEQAKGVLAERAQIEVDQAFGLLRKYARSHHVRLREVAEGLIEGRVGINKLDPSSLEGRH